MEGDAVELECEIPLKYPAYNDDMNVERIDVGCGLWTVDCGLWTLAFEELFDEDALPGGGMGARQFSHEIRGIGQPLDGEAGNPGNPQRRWLCGGLVQWRQCKKAMLLTQQNALLIDIAASRRCW